MRRSGWIELACAALTVSAGAMSCPAAPVTHVQLQNWGQNTYLKINASLNVSGTNTYAETASLGGVQSTYAFVWPLSTQFRLENQLTRRNPATFKQILKLFSNEVYNRYWTTTTGGYRSGVGAGATRFYDDNAHMAVALAEAYRITGDTLYLNRAIDTFNFVKKGEDLVGGGGTYFSEADHSFKDSAGTLQGARAAAMLYQATAQPSYLTDALRLYNWAKNTTQQPDGLFMEKLFLTGPKAGTVGDFTLVNFTGMGISANLELYAATGSASYLAEAQRIGNRSLTRFFSASTGAIQDEGFWAFELVDALDELSRADGNPLWLNKVEAAMDWLHTNREDPNGHYGTLWGRGGFQGSSPLSSWNLNDQASVAQAYLQTGLTPEPGVVGFTGVAVAGWLLGGRRRRRR